MLLLDVDGDKFAAARSSISRCCAANTCAFDSSISRRCRLRQHKSSPTASSPKSAHKSPSSSKSMLLYKCRLLALLKVELKLKAIRRQQQRLAVSTATQSSKLQGTPGGVSGLLRRPSGQLLHKFRQLRHQRPRRRLRRARATMKTHIWI
jgi:hypothetical protein